MKRCMLLALLFVFVMTSDLMAQNRVERPFQAQLNFSGAFLAAFGGAISNSEITEFDVENWALPGISFGYHQSKWKAEQLIDLQASGVLLQQMFM